MNYIILLAAAFMTIYWSSEFTQSKNCGVRLALLLWLCMGLL